MRVTSKFSTIQSSHSRYNIEYQLSQNWNEMHYINLIIAFHRQLQTNSRKRTAEAHYMVSYSTIEEGRN